MTSDTGFDMRLHTAGQKTEETFSKAAVMPRSTKQAPFSLKAIQARNAHQMYRRDHLEWRLWRSKVSENTSACSENLSEKVSQHKVETNALYITQNKVILCKLSISDLLVQGAPRIYINIHH